MLENRWQRYFRHHQIDKKTCAMFDGIGYQQTALLESYIDEERGAN